MSADAGKGQYVALAEVGGWDSRFEGQENLRVLHTQDGEQITDFDRAVEIATDRVRNGSVGELVVVELTVARRAVVKRAVEVAVQ